MKCYKSLAWDVVGLQKIMISFPIKYPDNVGVKNEIYEYCYSKERFMNGTE